MQLRRGGCGCGCGCGCGGGGGGCGGGCGAADRMSASFLCCDEVRERKQGARGAKGGGARVAVHGGAVHGGGGTFMSICHLAFIFFHPSTLMPLASTTASSAAP